jgi:protein SCO1/2
MKRARVALASLLLAALGSAAAEGIALRTGVFKPPRAAPDFALRGSDGAPLVLSRYRGKVVALGFGYTHCPDVCPTTLALLAKARRTLGGAAGDFQVVYVTVDPERDTPERMRQYIAAFDPSFLGATGTEAQLAAVRKGYGITTTQDFHHSSYVYLIDRDGKLRAMMPFGVSVDDVTHDVKALLAR